MSARTRLGVIFGGRSPEHGISVISARSILREADPERFDVVPIGITRGGAWLDPDETRTRLARAEAGDGTLGGECAAALPARPDVLATLAGLGAALPIVHGRGGEDGSLQGLIELAGAPCVGSGVAASAVGMDKALMRALFAARGVPQPRYAVRADAALAALARGTAPRETLAEIERTVGYPCFVKPANGGSSIGVSRVESREQLAGAAREAARYDRKALFEEAIEGREVECAVLGNADPRPSPLGEIRPRAAFYTYDAKYGETGADLIVPAPLGARLTERVQRIALEAWRALDCAGLARVDFLVREPDEAFVLEVNTLPGFTPISMFPRLWQEAGIGYGELIAELVRLALERHAQERSRA